MNDQEPPATWQLRRLRARREDLRRSELESCDQAEYERRNEAKEAVIRALLDKASPLVEEARKRKFVYFGCGLDSSTSNTPIKMQFADGKGAYYRRSLGITRLSLKHELKPTLADAVDMKIAVQGYVLSCDGISSTSRGMTARQV